MSSYTYVQFFINEVRAISITIRDDQELDFNPDTVTCLVENVSGSVLVVDTPAQIVANMASFTIDTTITANKGIYNAIWTINKDNLVYKHKTILTVEDLT